jgi:hypothetical protein
MSRLVEREVTIEVDGDERDVPVRCWVDVGHIGAVLDGRPEVLIDGEWSEMARDHADRIEDALCEQAINEESDAYDDRDPGDFL